MHPVHAVAILLASLPLLLPAHELGARPPSSNGGRALDDLIRTYAFQALVRPRTGVPYPVHLPSNVTGIGASVVRLRSGSLQKRGFGDFHEFDVPSGFKQTPLFVRIALVYQNLGNWSSVYYSLSGYRFLTPVVGLLAYDATDLTSTDHKMVEFSTGRDPILIRFGDVGSFPVGFTPNCVQFYSNGSHRLVESIGGIVCNSSSLGHFSIVVRSPPPEPQPHPPARNQTGGGGGGGGGRTFRSGRRWRIIVIVACGLIALLVVAMLLLWLWRLRTSRRIGEMVKRSEGEETLRTQKVGSANLPVASMVRTRPVLENDYMPSS